MKVPFLDLAAQHRALRNEALAALAATYDANRFCLGKDVEDFERSFASTLGYPAALGMNSGTAPLHVACMVAGFGPGDEVIVPPFHVHSVRVGRPLRGGEARVRGHRGVHLQPRSRGA
jgi:dTDP-4-amino-4,6-dideoxygalactose transaminase